MRDREATIPGDATHGDAPSPVYAHVPAGATRGGVVVHEIFGRQPDIERVVDRFATRGYAAVAPDLFHQGALPCIRAVFAAMRSGEEVAPVRQARRAREWLCAQAGLATPQVGIVGFCLGGGFALLAGAGWGAGSTNYGKVPPSERMRGIGPVIGCYGARDLPFRSEGQGAHGAPRAARGGARGAHLPDGRARVSHGRRPPHRERAHGAHPAPGYDPVAAPEAWSKIDAFFDRHLPSTAVAAQDN